MPVKRRHRDALRHLGFEVEEYVIPTDYDAPMGGRFPPIWGTAITQNGVDVAVIETCGEHTEIGGPYGLRNKYVLKTKRGWPASFAPNGGPAYGMSVHNLKREALAEFARALADRRWPIPERPSAVQTACDVPGHDPECECGYRAPNAKEQK